MKTFIIRLILIQALLTTPAFAENLFLEAGPGIGKSWHSEVVLLRYRKNTSELFGDPSYYEAILGRWSNENRASAAGIARGVTHDVSEWEYVSGAFGLVGVSDTTRNLGTSFEFYFRFCYGIRNDSYDFSFGIVHISNGKMFFKWDGPNNGENFITLSASLF